MEQNLPITGRASQVSSDIGVLGEHVSPDVKRVLRDHGLDVVQDDEPLPEHQHHDDGKEREAETAGDSLEERRPDGASRKNLDVLFLEQCRQFH
jgi:hypothetical protein